MAVAAATAAWSHSGLPPVPLRRVPIRDPQGRFATRTLRCTDPAADPAPLLTWFIPRGQMAVTCAEARRHRSVATRRQWSALAILRTTPALFGLFSLVPLRAHPRRGPTGTLVRQAAWYPKALPTFADALALVRRALWAHAAFGVSASDPDTVGIPRAFGDRLTDAPCYAA